MLNEQRPVMCSNEDCDNFKDRSTFQVHLLGPITSFHWAHPANLFEMWVVNLREMQIVPSRNRVSAEGKRSRHHGGHLGLKLLLKSQKFKRHEFMEHLLSSAPIRKIQRLKHKVRKKESAREKETHEHDKAHLKTFTKF